MTASAYASEAKITATLAVIGETYIATAEQDLYRQICLALGNRNTGGAGDPMTNTLTALGTSALANNKQGLLQQILVLAATNP